MKLRLHMFHSSQMVMSELGLSCVRDFVCQSVQSAEPLGVVRASVVTCVGFVRPAASSCLIRAIRGFRW